MSGEIHQKLKDLVAHEPLGEHSRYRSYSDLEDKVLKGYQKFLEPHFGCQIDGPGKFLLHSDSGGYPHCLAISVDEREGEKVCTVYDGTETFIVTLQELKTAAEEAMDKHSFATFKIVDEECDRDPDQNPAVKLLGLRAGMQRRKSSDRHRTKPFGQMRELASHGVALPMQYRCHFKPPTRCPQAQAARRLWSQSHCQNTSWHKLFMVALALDARLNEILLLRPDETDTTISKRDWEKANSHWMDMVKLGVDEAVHSWITNPGERTDT